MVTAKDPGEPRPKGRGRPQRRRRGGRRRRVELSPDLESARLIAAKRFGIEALREEQEKAIESVLSGRDTVVIQPTGYGKSLIYQLPGLLLDRPTLVVSPLIALMRDQEHSLKRRSVPVVRLDSTLRAAERREALARIAEGGRLIVLTTPETLESDAARPAFEAARAGLLCVDEAHCISEWGHDFRPAYLRLGAMRRALGIPAALALTATATPRVTDDIVARLSLEDPLVLRSPPHRENLELSVEITPGGKKAEVAGQLIKRLPRPGIVYCATTRAVDDIHAALVRARIPTARYHGKMRTPERDAAQKRFMRPGRPVVMVATSAFGMGVDKPDIRYILHYQVPGSLEQYVQEAGRAGRDGKPARCVLLFDEKDTGIQERLSAQGRPSAVQLRRLGVALKAWADEGRSVSTPELALSAQVPQTTTRSMCAELEQLGLLGIEAKRWVARVPPDDLARGVEDLAGRFETLRREDARRLGAITEYALTEGCRSAFLRRWFGEDDPPPCGHCDRCREAQGHELGDVARLAADEAGAIADGLERRTLLRKRPPPTPPEEEAPRARKKRRRGRRRKAGAPQAEEVEVAAEPAGARALAPEGAKKKRRARKRGRGRKQAEADGADEGARKQTARPKQADARKKKRRTKSRSKQQQSRQGESPQGQSPQGQSPQGQSQGQSAQGQSARSQPPQGQSPQGRARRGRSKKARAKKARANESAVAAPSRKRRAAKKSGQQRPERKEPTIERIGVPMKPPAPPQGRASAEDDASSASRRSKRTG